MKIVFLCSGMGGNLKFVWWAIQNNWLPKSEIVHVFYDSEGPFLEFAKKNHIPCSPINPSDKDQLNLVSDLEKIKPDLIVTTFHKILKPKVVGAFSKRLVNLHYSLLPAFGGNIGTKPVELALQFGEKIIGVTVHFVEEKVDAGLPLVQAAFPTQANDTVDSVMNLIFRLGALSLLNAILLARTPQADFPSARSVIFGERSALINPLAFFPEELKDESGWKLFQSL